MSNVYSFLDVTAALTGPGGAISLGSGASNAEEGISVQYAADINTMQIGADGNGQHSLHANKSGTITVRLLKTSPINAQLAAMCNFQRASASSHGQNTLVINDKNRGDVVSARQGAFKKFPDLNYAMDAGIIEWVFDFIRIDIALGE